MRVFIFCFLLLLICLSQISCNDNSAGDFTGDPRIVSMQLNGTLPNWNYGEGYSIIVTAQSSSMNNTKKTGLDTAYISSSGEFILILHTINESMYTEPINGKEPNCDVNIDPSPAYMTKVNTVFEIYKDNMLKGVVTGRAHHVGNDTTGTFYITYNAFSAAGLITGSKVCLNNDSTYTYFYEYNLPTNKDWTMVVSTITIGIAKTLYTVTGTEPPFYKVWEYSLNK